MSKLSRSTFVMTIKVVICVHVPHTLDIKTFTYKWVSRWSYHKQISQNKYIKPD